MIFKEGRCFHQTDHAGAEHGYRLTFIQSGFEWTWIKISECPDYSLTVEYASDEENKLLRKLREGR